MILFGNTIAPPDKPDPAHDLLLGDTEANFQSLYQ